MTVWIVLFVSLWVAQDSHPGDHGATPEPGNIAALPPTVKIAIPAEANRPVYKPVRCDADGNIYFRAYQSEDHRVPVVRVDANGATLKYTLDSSSDFKVAP